MLTVASNETDGYKRFLRSVEIYGFRDNLKVLGLGEPWLGGNMNSVGGGYKVNLLKDALVNYKNDNRTIVIFTDRFFLQIYILISSFPTCILTVNLMFQL